MIYLTFDIEEFDSPFHYSQSLTFEQQMEISIKGSKRILDLLKEKSIPATFFCTANFALHAPEIIHRIVEDGHEVASHGYYHNRFEVSHILESKTVLEKISGVGVSGFRMAYMSDIDTQTIADAGYQYNSSLNPTYLPGNYNHFDKPRSIYRENGIWQIPASVSPLIRIPLFWLSMHNLPLELYVWLCKLTLRKDGYLNIYLHPWEFEELNHKHVTLPWYVKRNSGEKLMKRLEQFINHFSAQGEPFGLLKDCPETFGKKV